MVLVSFAEILSIGGVFSFLWVLTEPERIFHHDLAQPFLKWFHFSEANELLMPLAVALVIAILLSASLRLLLLFTNTRLSFLIGADLSVSAYRRTLYQPYAVHVARNSSEVISGIKDKIDGLLYTTISPCLTIISATIILMVVLSAMLIVDIVFALSILASISLVYTFIIYLTKRRLALNGERIARESTKVYKALQEGLGGIRDVLIDGTQNSYCAIYQNAELPLRKAKANNEFIGNSPRIIVELFGMLLIISLAVWLVRQSDEINSSIPILGALAFSAQRLLPIMQQAYAAWSSMRGGQSSLHDALVLLDQPLPQYIEKPSVLPVLFERGIRLNQVAFRYGPKKPWVLKDISFVIPKGSRVGFVGTTGSGKSTLLDIMMGLLIPTKGVLEVDGQTIDISNYRSWQSHIAHVPQDIFLTDATIAENIAFGLASEEIDFARVRKAARQAQLSDFIESLDDGYKSIIGERGVRLSGGQRQRIGIARALYKQADVIIFDEATSALDTRTESAVMQSIEGLGDNLTLIIVAHRTSTLRGCAQIVELDHGEIKKIGSYQEVLASESVLPTEIQSAD